jgi:hypothetical protein
MYKDFRYINAGENEIYRYGKEAVRRASAALEANEAGFYSIPVDGGKYWTIGTSNGKYGEFAKMNDTIFSVNKGGFAYAKAGTDKGEAFVDAIESMIAEMKRINSER